MAGKQAKTRATKQDRPPRVWQRMLSGRRLDLLDPSPMDIEIVDIAHGLARVARWNGQTTGPHIFSVAQHSLLVEKIAATLDPALDRAGRLFMLLHDAPEYVIGDMISPFKATIGEAYKTVEQRILGAILLRYALPATPEPNIARLAKRADRIAAFLEAVAIAGFTRSEAERIFGRPSISAHLFEQELASTSIEASQARYLERFNVIDQGL